jgi:RNA polymerase sigma factor (sigma-70 family)
LFRALRLIAGMSEAEDLMQEAFFRVWRRWELVAGMEDPTGYLYRTAMNLHRSAHRRARRAVERPAWASSPGDPPTAAESRDVFARWLADLTPRQREAVVLTEISGYPADQAARVMRIKPATVYVLISQARSALKTITEANDG